MYYYTIDTRVLEDNWMLSLENWGSRWGEEGGREERRGGGKGRGREREGGREGGRGEGGKEIECDTMGLLK